MGLDEPVLQIKQGLNADKPDSQTDRRQRTNGGSVSRLNSNSVANDDNIVGRKNK